MRRKLKLAFIDNNSARKASFKKRRSGLMKKMRELTTLCDVSACIVIYSPGTANPGEAAAAAVAVWPNEDEARRLIRRFLMMPEIERCKKMMTQEGYLKERADKMARQVQKLIQRNKETVLIHSMRQVTAGKKRLGKLGLEELEGIKLKVEQKMKEVDRRREFVRHAFENSVGISSLPPPTAEELAGRRGFPADWMFGGAVRRRQLPDQNRKRQGVGGISGGKRNRGFQIGNKNAIGSKIGSQPYMNGNIRAGKEVDVGYGYFGVKNGSGGKSNANGTNDLEMVDNLNSEGNSFYPDKGFGGGSESGGGGITNLPNTTNVGANFESYAGGNVENVGFGFVPSGVQENSSGSGTTIGNGSGSEASSGSGGSNDPEFSPDFGKNWPDFFSPTP